MFAGYIYIWFDTTIIQMTQMIQMIQIVQIPKFVGL